MTQNTGWLVVAAGLLYFRLDLLGFVFARRAQKHRAKQHDQTLTQTEPQEGGFVALLRDHPGDWQNGQRGTGTETGGGDARRQTAAIREPLQCATHAGAVYGAGADTADGSRDVQKGERIGIGVHHPADAAQQTAEQNDNPWAVLVDEPAFDRDQPGFGQNEDGERDLNRGASPPIFVVHRLDEQRPTILQVGDHRHANHTNC